MKDNSNQGVDVFVITLQRATERRLHMNALLSKLSIDFEFIDGYDGRLLQPEVIKNSYSKIGTFKNIGRELSKGEIGCALSHRKAYHKIIENNIDVALILEDDVSMGHNTMAFIDNVLYDFVEEWDIIFLGYKKEAKMINTLQEERQLSDSLVIGKVSDNTVVYGAYSYLVKKEAAARFLSETEILAKPIDHYTGDARIFNLWITVPVIINTSDYFASILDDDRADVISIYGQDGNNYYIELARKTGIIRFLQMIKLAKIVKAIRGFYIMRKPW